MKDDRILGGFTRKSYGPLHAPASCCELADELTLAQLSNKMKHVSQAQIELHALQKSATPKCFGWSRAKHSRNLCSASKLVGHKATRKTLFCKQRPKATSNPFCRSGCFGYG